MNRPILTSCSLITKNTFDKGRTVSEILSPSRDDGLVARILWEMAIVIESDKLGEDKAEAEELRNRAERARQTLLAEGEGGFAEDDYYAIVPLFYRRKFVTA